MAPQTHPAKDEPQGCSRDREQEERKEQSSCGELQEIAPAVEYERAVDRRRQHAHEVQPEHLDQPAKDPRDPEFANPRDGVRTAQGARLYQDARDGSRADERPEAAVASSKDKRQGSSRLTQGDPQTPALGR